MKEIMYTNSNQVLETLNHMDNAKNNTKWYCNEPI